MKFENFKFLTYSFDFLGIKKLKYSWGTLSFRISALRLTSNSRRDFLKQIKRLASLLKLKISLKSIKFVLQRKSKVLLKEFKEILIS